MYRFFAYSPFSHYFEYDWYNLELLRLLGSAAYEGCDAAEFLETVGKIRPNDAASWQNNWLALAERTRDLATDMQNYGHVTIARGAFLRASNYFRCAQYLFPTLPDTEQSYNLFLYHKSIKCFQLASSMMEHDVKRIQIPYLINDVAVSMPGWLHVPAKSQRIKNRKIPVLICIGGADSTQEELYFISAASGPALGYAILTFDGPGQGLVLRQNNIPMNPDGENLIKSVLHFLENDSIAQSVELDLQAICVTGQSLGGFLALRAASDPRVKACVAVDPFYDMWDLAMARMPAWLFSYWEQGVVGDWLIDWAARAHGNANIQTRYQFGLAQRMLGTSNPGSTLRDMKRYTFKQPGKKNDLLANITCPVLVTGAAADATSFLPEFSTDAIMKGLVNVRRGQKELWVAKEYSEGGAQAKSGAWPLLQHRTFKFLDQKLAIERNSD